MKPFRKKVAIAIDGGGIKGVMVTKALSMLEDHLGKPCNKIFSLTAGTSTGSIIAAAIATGINAVHMHKLYCRLAERVFKKCWLYYLWPLARYKYSNRPLIQALRKTLGEVTMGDLWNSKSRIDVVITLRDLFENRTLFVKPWKEDYKDWKVWFTVLASCTVLTFFPIVKGQFIDGGVDSYGNPCYLAAFEAAICLNWAPAETTLLSFGTGREKKEFRPYTANRWFPWQWLEPILDSFLSNANDQQVRIVQEFFKEIDFRRFQIDIRHIPLDDPSKIGQLSKYGEILGQMVLNNKMDEYVIRPPDKAV